MARHAVGAVPVVTDDRRVVGVVSEADLLHKMEFAGRSRTEPETVAVTVERGVVTLAGTVDRRSTVPVVVPLVESVAGVVEVVDHLSYHYDDTADLNRHGLMAATVRETVHRSNGPGFAGRFPLWVRRTERRVWG